MDPWIDAKKSGELEILLSTKTKQNFWLLWPSVGFRVSPFFEISPFFDKEIGKKSFGLFFFGWRFCSVNSTNFFLLFHIIK
jgi:hypothetical protein